jgi:methylase of polypeptide subunit release factors
MPTPDHERVLEPELRDPLARAGESLARAGYSEDALAVFDELMGRAGALTAANARAITEDGGGVGLALRLFAAGLEVDRQKADALLGPAGLDALVRAGVLVDGAGAGVRAEISLLPQAGLWTTRDFVAALRPGAAISGYVLGIGESSRRLDAMTVRRRSRLTLDIGTGQGFQAVRAATKSERVIGTDVNPRALWCGAISAAMSGVGARVELRSGSLYEPVMDVAGRADLIVSNPPYVVTPWEGRECLSSEMRGDGFVASLVRGAGPMLAEGGVMCLVGEWACGESWDSRPRAWAAGQGLDAWILGWDIEDAKGYATRWLRELEQLDGRAPRAEAARVAAWVDALRREGIREMASGAIVLQKRSGVRNWIRSDRVEPGPLGDAGEQVEAVLAGETLAREWEDDRLARAVLRPRAPTVIEQRWRPRTMDGGASALSPESATLRQTRGWAMALGVEGAMLDLMARFDGVRSVREVAHATAGELGLDGAALEARILPIARRLASSGHFAVREASQSE